MPRVSDRSVADTSKSRVIAYIDGFNLYWGMKEAYRRKYLWLDLQAMVESLLRPEQQLVVARYFTARVRNDAAGGSRQADYLEALSACPKVEVTIGRFQERQMHCNACKATWKSYEEKETDVAIAAAIVRDAARHSMDTALVVSADSDMLPALRAAKEMQPTMAVVAAFPPKRNSVEIAKFVTASFVIAEKKLKTSQLAPSVSGRKRVVSRPAHWA
jgi:uncharacterized LabA/DUF88 family protein